MLALRKDLLVVEQRHHLHRKFPIEEPRVPHQGGQGLVHCRLDNNSTITREMIKAEAELIMVSAFLF